MLIRRDAFFALAAILDRGSRGDAARSGGVGLQVIRDWVLRFNTGCPEALKTRKAPSKTPILTNDQRVRLAEAVEAGPRPYIDGPSRRLHAKATDAYKKRAITFAMPQTSASRLASN